MGETGSRVIADAIRTSLSASPIDFERLDTLLVDAAAAYRDSRSAELADAIAEALYRTPLVQLEVRRVLFDEDEVADVVQEAIAAVIVSLPNFRGESRFRSWARRIAHNKAVDHLRRRQRWSLGDQAAAIDDEFSFSSQLASRCDVDAAIATLPEHYRVVVRLRDLEFMSYDEIAETLGVEIGTVRSRLARGRARLAAMSGLRPDFLEPTGSGERPL